MANFNPGPRTAIAAVRDSKNDIETWKKNGIRREEIVTVLNERYGLNISLVAFDKALYRLRKSTDEPSLADVDSVSAAETNFSEASGPEIVKRRTKNAKAFHDKCENGEHTSMTNG
ncbi:hypothetical protein AB2706_25375 [Klebsiella quasipneumoniae]|uniref:hypothetical protein n=1 Tax=Klebsiella quasipneumoniae TaxID=1463165 RepID=UPI003463C5ED